MPYSSPEADYDAILAEERAYQAITQRWREQYQAANAPPPAIEDVRADIIIVMHPDTEKKA
jgi:hypothetical protein